MLSFTGELGWAGCLQVGPGAGSQPPPCPPGPAGAGAEEERDKTRAGCAGDRF